MVYHLHVPPQLTRCLQGALICESVLKCLDLRGTMADDNHALIIGRLIALEVLDLSYTRITDTGIGHLLRQSGSANLHGLKQLQSFNLESTLITKVSIIKLNRLPRLVYMNLTRTKITKGAVRQELVENHGWSLSIVDKHLDLVELPSGLIRRSATSSMVARYFNASKLPETRDNDLMRWIDNVSPQDAQARFNHCGRKCELLNESMRIDPAASFKPPLHLTRTLIASEIPKKESTIVPQTNDSRIRLKRVLVESDFNPFGLDLTSRPETLPKKSFKSHLLRHS